MDSESKRTLETMPGGIVVDGSFLFHPVPEPGPHAATPDALSGTAPSTAHVVCQSFDCLTAVH